MAKREFAIGSTSQSIAVFCRNSSTGAGYTGLVYNTSGLLLYYFKQGIWTYTQISLASQTYNGAWTSGGFAEINSTYLPGWYRIDLPDAVFSTECVVDLHLYGASLLIPTPIEIQVGGSPIRSGITRNQALAKFPFNMVLSTNGITAATGKTITAQRSIDGGAFASCANSASELSNGSYYIDLAAADLNGTSIHFKFTNADCVDRFITVITTP